MTETHCDCGERLLEKRPVCGNPGCYDSFVAPILAAEAPVLKASRDKGAKDAKDKKK